MRTFEKSLLHVPRSSKDNQMSKNRTPLHADSAMQNVYLIKWSQVRNGTFHTPLVQVVLFLLLFSFLYD